MVLLSRRERDEVLDEEAEKLPERGWVAAEPYMLVLVHDPGEVGHQERAAARHEILYVSGGSVGDEVEVRGDDDPVA